MPRGRGSGPASSRSGGAGCAERRRAATTGVGRHHPAGRWPRPRRPRSARLVGMGYDVRAVRARFPALRAGTAHFDGPGGSQVPDAVAAAVAAALTSPLANRGRVTAAERAADEIVLAA